MHTRETILKAIDAFLARTGMTERQFSIEVAKDHKFIKRLRRGDGITLTLIERAEQYMADWPHEAAPEQSRGAA